MKQAVFAGGCFWCMEPPFSAREGVASVESGYAGGAMADPSYEDVSSGGTGHREAVRVTYDPDVVQYSELLGIFWRQIDPFDPGGQFADRGEHYKTAVFYATDGERKAAEESKREVAEAFGEEVVTEILPLTTFYPAEEYHQRYAEKNPLRYRTYKVMSGRESTLKSLWE